MIEYIMTGGLTLLLAMTGTVWSKVDKMNEKFDAFRDDCRDRHEDVLTKNEFWHEHTPLEATVIELKSRIDRCDACREVADRR